MTCFAERSGPVLLLPGGMAVPPVPETGTAETAIPPGKPFGPPSAGTPALRKYLLTMMSTASCDHVSGASASSIWNTTDPSGFVIRDDRFTHRAVEKGSAPGVVNRRKTFMDSILTKKKAFRQKASWHEASAPEAADQPGQNSLDLIQLGLDGRIPILRDVLELRGEHKLRVDLV